MCGLAIILGLNGAQVEESTLQRMTAAIAHRGPDDSGILISGPVGLGFRRLSILDLSPAGHQPMVTPDGNVMIVFNGEIYNYVELRDELTALGHRFVSTGDTEVLLHAYLQWGTECVVKLNGMWAFVLYDKRRGVVFGSRDRFGMKPLYRFSGRNHILFGSEIKAIRASGLYQGATNWHTVSRYFLEARIDDRAETFYADIEQVPAGTAFELTLEGQFRQWRYWSLDALPAADCDDPAGAFAALFEDSVRLHMRSDVPVGVHLSGGLDSTSIICASARLRLAAQASGPLMAFCYVAPEFDESRYLADTIRQTAATAVTLDIKPGRLWDLLGEVLWFQDEPIYSITHLVGYELMRLTKSQGLKVILNGQGADETIGGYPNYFKDYWCTLMAQGRFAQAYQEIGRYVEGHGGNRSGLFFREWRRLVQTRLAGMSAYRRLSRWKRQKLDTNRQWFTPEVAQQLASEDRIPVPANLNASLAHSVDRHPLPILLRIEDRNSMAHSVECRLPFLDYRLVSLLFSLPPDWRVRGPWNKYVLREAMRGRIPESVRARVDKMGFPVPARRWVADALCEPLLDILNSGAARERGIYNAPVIIADIERHRRGEIDVAGSIFDVAQYEVWSRL